MSSEKSNAWLSVSLLTFICAKAFGVLPNRIKLRHRIHNHDLSNYSAATITYEAQIFRGRLYNKKCLLTSIKCIVVLMFPNDLLS